MKAIVAMPVHLRTPGEVGAAIRAGRRALGWDQAELAKRVGVSRLWVSQVEGGKPGAGLGLVLRAFAALGWSLSLTPPGEPDTPVEPPAPASSVDLAAILNAARQKRSS